MSKRPQLTTIPLAICFLSQFHSLQRNFRPGAAWHYLVKLYVYIYIYLYTHVPLFARAIDLHRLEAPMISSLSLKDDTCY